VGVACEHPDHLRRVADRLEELLLPLPGATPKITGGSASAVENCATGWWKKTAIIPLP
jgi:hypothetical protein